MSRSHVLGASLAGGVLLLACGGKLEGDPAASGSAPLCAAATVACDLPGVSPVVDACSACVDAALCQCHDLNPPGNWSVPASCDVDGEVCGRDDYVGEHACQVAAVGVVRCMLGRPRDACSSAYFAAHPASIDPFGMEYGLYGCAVCSACAGPCAAAPDFAAICCAATPAGTCPR